MILGRCPYPRTSAFLMVRCENVSFRYRDDAPPVLNNINLTIMPGEAVAVMGANGSGKSTFARLIAGLHETTRGRVTAGDASGDHAVGILFQNPDNQMVAVTVEKEIAFALENQGVPPPEMERRITETLTRFSITHLRRRLTSELSGGEKQRVALAAVMVCEPTVLVLDEPDSYLDEAGKAALDAELRKLHERNPAMIRIHITQYPQAARMYGRLLVFDGGVIAADGDPAEILDDPEFARRAALAFDIGADGDVEIPGRAVNGGSDTRITRVEIHDLSFSYPGASQVLGPLEARIESGTVTGIAGASGSGKSTLGLLLCGLLAPTSGEIRYLAGDQKVSPDDIPGRVAAILQQPERQFFLPTCEEEVAFGPKNVGRPLDADQMRAFFELTGLTFQRFAPRDPFRLSGGEKRRLAFGAVLAMGPSVVVFDEPTCALDPEGVGRFVQLARALRNSGTGAVVITHDGDVLRALADSIIVLDREKGGRQMPSASFFDDPDLASMVSPRYWSR